MHKIYKNLSLAYGSGNLIIGTDAVLDKMRKHKIKLIFVLADSSINTLKLIQNKANHYGVPVVVINDYEDEFSKIFKNKSIKVIGLINNNFTKLIKQNIEE